MLRERKWPKKRRATHSGTSEFKLELKTAKQLTRVVSSPDEMYPPPEEPKKYKLNIPKKQSCEKSSQPKHIPSSPRHSVGRRKRKGSYSGDPLHPNLTPRNADPVHTRSKSLKHTNEANVDNIYHEVVDGVVDDYTFIIPEKPPVSRFDHNAPALTARRTQWIHLSCKGEVPSERIYHASAVVKKLLYVTCGTDGETMMNQIYSLDLVTYSWKKLSPTGILPPHRYGHSCTAVGTDIIIFGGRNDQFVLADMHVYNTKDNKWTRIRINSPIPGRAYHQTIYHKEHLYIIGGIDCTGKTVTKVIKFHLGTKTWKLISINGFRGRARFSAVDLGDGKIGLLGGCKSNKSLFNTGGKFEKDLLIIDIVYETTIVKEKLPPSFRLVNVTAVPFESNIIVFGGYNQRKQVSNELKIMTVKDNCWAADKVVPKGIRPTDLEGHTMNIFRHGLIIFGGQSQEKGLSNSCYLLQIGALSKDSPSSIDLFESLIRPIREDFLRKAKKIPYICMEEISCEEKIARGATGNVIKALWENRYVVLKEFGSADEEIFQAEVNILAGLNHPNIVECLGVIREPRRIIVLEYAPLGDLFHFCKKQQQRFSWKLIMSFAIGITKGMIHLHSHNILHRDLKSLNVLVTSTDPKAPVCAKIVDFGDSKETFQYQESSQCGTVRWTAPEIFNEEPFTPKSDVFSFAIILWEIYTLKPPYERFKREYEVVDFVLSGGRPEIPSECPAGYQTLLHSCWHENPNLRPTFDHILQVLLELKIRLCS